MNTHGLMSEGLIRRVLDCFPAGNYALPGLLRLVGIVESREIETAAVECKEEPRMLINPEFVAEWAQTSEKLFMLVMHELHHILLGHTRLFSAGTELDIRGALYGAVLDCHEQVHPVVHLFSTVTADVSFRDLRGGKCPTTGGTDINCVIDHLVAHKIRRAVIITDGLVGQPLGEGAKALRRVVLGAAYTPDAYDEDALKEYTRSSVRLEAVGGA